MWQIVNVNKKKSWYERMLAKEEGHEIGAGLPPLKPLLPQPKKPKPCCDLWEPGCDAINGPIVLQTIRSGHAYQFDSKYTFKFCPWCGKKRKK